MPSKHSLPKISIVTPSFNQAEYLESTIESVLSQGYPNLEYIIIDGGSSDGSVEIIKRYKTYLSYWVSEPDQGQYNAINKGFAHATGEILGWINSSDLFCPWTFKVLASVFDENQDVQWITSSYPLRWDIYGLPVKMKQVKGYCKESFFQNRLNIMQEATFWRKSLWDKAGASLSEKFSHAADFELWARFFTLNNLYSIGVPLGGNRIHSQQKYHNQAYSSERTNIIEEYSRNSAEGFLSSVRRTIVFFKMHEVPFLRFFVNKYFGYDVYSIVTFNDEIATRWKTITYKQLV